MRLERHRRTLAATAVVATVLATGACGTSFNAQTNQQYQAGIGADARNTPVQILAALLVTGADGSATLSATLLNTTDSDQSLTSVTVTDAEGNELALEATPADAVLLTPGESRAIGRTDETTQNFQSKVYTVSGIETVGAYYTLTLTFDRAGEVTLAIPSVARNSTYADIALPPGADAAENLIVPGEATTQKNADNAGGGH